MVFEERESCIGAKLLREINVPVGPNDQESY